MSTRSAGLPNRRDFLAASLALAGAPAALADPAAPALPERAFGKTPRRLPILAFGGSALVSRWAVTYGPQLDFATRVAMVRHAYDAGIRYFDTSPNYTESESIIGEALHDVRDQIYLATKVGVPPSDDAILQPGQVAESVEKSLARLRTDHVDCIQVHGPAFEYEGFKRAEALHAELSKLRDRQLCRWIGLTGHNAFETMHRLIDTGHYDQLLLAYGYFPKGMDLMLSPSSLTWRERCLDRARALGMGVCAMKVMASFVMGFQAAKIAPDFTAEKLDRLRAAALRWTLNDNRVDLLVVGVTRPADIDENIKTLKSDLALTSDDRAILAEFTALARESPIIKAMKTV